MVRSIMAGSMGLLTGCPDDVAPGVPSPTGGSSTGDRPGITTFGGTVDPTLPGDASVSATGDGSGAGTSTDPTTGPGVTTGDPGTTTDDPTTTTDPGTTTDDPASTSTGMGGGSTSTGMGGGSTSTGMGGGSTSTGMGGSTSTGGGSSSTGPACNDVGGTYDACVNMAGAVDTTPCNAPGTSTCLTTGGAMGAPFTGSVCSVDTCMDECDCPAAPPTGNAVVTCSDVTGDPMALFCSLDCSMGETCPTGMVCFGGFVCLWPTPAGLGDPYGDC
ncbi:MAG: hypothetical protein AB1Z98_17855, partial [Nannocystaceae bacterium]